MLARYREVVETVLRFRGSKEKLIRRAVIALIPRLAAFAPERFAATYLRVCSEHLLGVLRCGCAGNDWTCGPARSSWCQAYCLYMQERERVMDSYVCTCCLALPSS